MRGAKPGTRLAGWQIAVPDFPAGRREQGGRNRQQRRLPRAIGSEQRDDLAGSAGQGYAIERATTAEVSSDVVEGERIDL